MAIETIVLEKALRNKYTFNFAGAPAPKQGENIIKTPGGQLSTQDLYDLSLEHLDMLYTQLDARLKEVSTSGLLVKPTKEADILTNKLAIVKHIFETKQAEAEAKKLEAQKRLEAKAERDLLLEAKAKQQVKSLEGLTPEQIEKRLAELAAMGV